MHTTPHSPAHAVAPSAPAPSRRSCPPHPHAVAAHHAPTSLATAARPPTASHPPRQHTTMPATVPITAAHPPCPPAAAAHCTHQPRPPATAARPPSIEGRRPTPARSASSTDPPEPFFFSDSLPARSFYSSRLDSYIETQDPTGGPEVVEILYNI
jgi:hypothetical protein